MSVRNGTLDHPLASPNNHYFDFDAPQRTARRCTSEPPSSPTLGHKHRKQPNQSTTVPTSSTITHTVCPGDTLENLALRYNVSVAALKTANRLYAPHALFLRATIAVPGTATKTAPLPPRPPPETAESKAPLKTAEGLTQLLADIDADVQTARARLPAAQTPPPPPQKQRLYPPSSTSSSPMYTPRGTRRVTVRPNAVVFDVGEVLVSVAAEMGKTGKGEERASSRALELEEEQESEETEMRSFVERRTGPDIAG
ncbi:hypothetical protein BDZ88DRAFT_287791 [Geranomyces variabilis]|nr:hypothetical protein BDZ88DRAFT_287791 [Geranomyces variabilis]KAJ3136416.1 hypothetical protein HDU90_003123 [Geranomyces variabilis]